MGKHRGGVARARREHAGWWVMGVALLIGVVCVIVGFMSCVGFLLS